MDFLDLTDATDTEKKQLQEILYSHKDSSSIELPFDLSELSVEKSVFKGGDESISVAPENTNQLVEAHIHSSQQQHVTYTEHPQVPVVNGVHYAYDNSARLPVDNSYKMYPAPVPVMTSLAPLANGPTSAAMSNQINMMPMASAAGLMMDENGRGQHHAYQMPPMFAMPNGHFLPPGPPYSAAPSPMYPQMFHFPHFYYMQQPMQGPPPPSSQPFSMGNQQQVPISNQSIDCSENEIVAEQYQDLNEESGIGSSDASESNLLNEEKLTTNPDNELVVQADESHQDTTANLHDIDHSNKQNQQLENMEKEVKEDSSNKSWASLFKGNRSNTTSILPSAFIETKPHEVTVAPVPSYFPDLEQAEAAQVKKTKSTPSASGFVHPADSQVSSVPLQEDAMATKLGNRLREIHLKHSLPYLAPRGFVNRGNWCYINATLQALLYCPPFYNLMREIGETPGINREHTSTPIIDSFAKFFANFLPSEKLIRQAKNLGFNHDELPKQDNFEPKCIYEVLGAIKSECLKGKQEDAEEFLSSVLNGLHDEMIALLKYSNEEVIDEALTNGFVEKDPEEKDDDNDALWKEVGPKHKALPTRSAKVNKSPVMDIFGGSLLSIRTAGKDVCGNRQPFFTLQLDIQNEKVKSVEDAIRHLTASETIHDFTCPKTNQAMDANFQTFVEQLPPILILHLKCFVFDKDGGSKKSVKKIEYPVDFEFPKESLHQDRNDKNKFSKTYKLLSVVYHDGTESGKGHYITDIFHIGRSQWLRCDDVSIKAISTQQLLSPQLPRVPYLLFYRRCDTLRSTSGPAQSSSRGSSSSHAH
ncbi:Ubiquitin carboxyl-terminal hydrolase 10 [Halotydeus destructor]|nr:Ubiquitin carboxyl-terminal hydrolase 10 [Halotydeus destructor]